MAMIHFFHQFDFSFYGFTSVWLFQFVFFVNFHGDFFVGGLVKPNSYDGVCSLTNLFSNHVIVQWTFLAKDHGVVKSIWNLSRSCLISLHLLWLGLWIHNVLCCIGGLLQYLLLLNNWLWLNSKLIYCILNLLSLTWRFDRKTNRRLISCVFFIKSLKS